MPERSRPASTSDGREGAMRSPRTRKVMAVLFLAGTAFALSTHGAAARGGQGSVAVIIKSDSFPSQHSMKIRHGHRVATHRTHRFGSRAFHSTKKHGIRHGSRVKRQAVRKPALRAIQRSAPFKAGFRGHFRGHGERGFHKPPFHAFGGHAFKGPRVLIIQKPVKQRSEPHGVVVVRPSDFHGFAGGHRHAQSSKGGKLILLSPSSSGFKHIIVPSHGHTID